MIHCGWLGSKYKLTNVRQFLMNSEPHFHFWCDEVCFHLTWSVRLTGRWVSSNYPSLQSRRLKVGGLKASSNGSDRWARGEVFSARASREVLRKRETPIFPLPLCSPTLATTRVFPLRCTLSIHRRWGKGTERFLSERYHFRPPDWWFSFPFLSFVPSSWSF